MSRLPPAPLFTTAEARTAGCTVSALKHAVRTGEVLRLRRGVYARAGSEDRLRDERAAALAHPGAVLDDVSAARVHGFPLVGPTAGPPTMTVPPRTNADLPGVHPHRARLRPEDVVVVDTMVLTSVARTAVDVARHHPLRTSVPVLDHVLHTGSASADELRDVLDFCRTWPGARRARRAARLCDSRAESPLESISRLVIPRLGLPVPEPQVTFLDGFGHPLGRGDFYWDEFGVVGEADGLGKYLDPGALDAQGDRHEGLDDVGLEVTRWGWRRVWFEPRLVAIGVRNACARGAARDRAGLPRRWTCVPSPRQVVL